MAAALNLVNAAAGKRLAAWLLDAVPVLIAWMVFVAVNAEAISRMATSEAAGASLAGSYLVLVAILLAYGIAVWGWEAQTGKTPGNLALGLRTSDEDGFAPGWLKVFLRRLIVAVSGIVPLVGPVVVVLSNLWDANHQRQGWHDKIAKTLVVDVNQGRNPITTGGLFGPSTFAPGGATAPGQAGHPDFAGTAPATEWPALSAEYGGPGPIASIPGRPAPLPAATDAPAPTDAPARVEPAERDTLVADAEVSHPDEELGHTQLRPAAPAAVGARLVFDDGQVLKLATTALVGRNPAPAGSEEIAELFNFADMGRSVSKTHLHLAADSSGVWVTDRNSTNGSGVTGADGQRRQLAAGHAQRAVFGDTVHFGDRHFRVERA